MAVRPTRIGVAVAPGDDKFFAAYGGCGVLEDHFECVRNFAVVIEDVLSAEGTHGLGRIHAHRPMDDVQQMDAPIGQCSSGIVPEGAKAADAAIAVVGVVGSGSKPKIPVEPSRGIGVGRIAHAGGRAIAVNPRLGKRDLSDFSALHQFDRFLEMFTGTLLGADLHDAVVFRHSLHHLAALGQRVRERLFDIDILARFAGHDHGDGVPMVRGCNDHRLNVFVVEDRAKVFEAFGLSVRKLEAAVQIGYEWIGDGDDIDLISFQEIL